MKFGTVCIVDPSMKDFGGHSMSYSVSVADALAASGVKPILLSHRDCLEQSCGHEVLPTFSMDWHQQTALFSSPLAKLVLGLFSKMPFWLQSLVHRLLWAVKSILKRRGNTSFALFKGELASALSQGDGNGARLVFLHTLHNEAIRSLLWDLLNGKFSGDDYFSFVVRVMPGDKREVDAWRDVLSHLSSSQACSSRVSLFTDTEILSDAYNALSEFHFGVLPIPVSPVFNIPRGSSLPRKSGPITLGYLGDARSEKGYQHLPGMVNELSDLFEGGKVRLVHQCNFSNTIGEPEVRAARDFLLALPQKQAEGFTSALDMRAYEALVRSIDILILPYDAKIYEGRSSGVLAEALAIGIPAVVPAGTWMADAVQGGLGQHFEGIESFPDAVKSAVKNHLGLRGAAVAQASRWRARHSPQRLVDTVINENDAV